jgi:hypothetical protein
MGRLAFWGHKLARSAAWAFAASMIVVAADEGRAQPAVTYLPQNWSAADRDAFYTTSQGSRIMPLAWFTALKHSDGQPILADALARYGYLANPRSPTNPHGLPVGFTLDSRTGQPYIGMTCAACHTRQIEVGDQLYRIDGGPAIVDFEALLRDIQSAVRTVLADADTSPAFGTFAQAVLGPGDTPQARTALRLEVTQWFAGYDAIVRGALPPQDWGMARIDAVGMIFNRVAGLDLDIWPNIKPADAPVRYPFLWNASRQDKTQWPGFAQNGLDVLAMGRNVGEVLGVFAWFHPTAGLLPAPDGARHVEYLRGSSPDFVGLQKLETKIRALGSPKWPDGWPVRSELQARGQQIFNVRCAECHGERDAAIPEAWQTPVRNVGTDPKEWNNLQAMSASGALARSRQPPFIGDRLDDPDTTKNVLANAVVGTVLQDLWENALPPSKRKADGVWQAVDSDLHRFGPGEVNIQSADIQSADTNKVLENLNDRLKDLFNHGGDDPGAAYEARVLHGVWAAAPYLHNGSIPTLTELLKPASKRVRSFKIGAKYDPVAVGLAVDQGPFSSTYLVGDCTGVSGNGNCGHEYGTDLSVDDQSALLEYLKQL